MSAGDAAWQTRLLCQAVLEIRSLQHLARHSNATGQGSQGLMARASWGNCNQIKAVTCRYASKDTTCDLLVSGHVHNGLCDDKGVDVLCAESCCVQVADLVKEPLPLHTGHWLACSSTSDTLIQSLRSGHWRTENRYKQGLVWSQPGYTAQLCTDTG
jgi:hypothetical protein